MSTKRFGLLGPSELEGINKRLRALEQHPLLGSDEIVFASAARRARDLRDSVTALTLGLSVLALAVAVVIGGFGANEYLALFLIGYLFIGGALGLVGIRLMQHAATAEIARAVVERRLVLASETRPSRQDIIANRRSNEISRSACFLRRLSARVTGRVSRTR